VPQLLKDAEGVCGPQRGGGFDQRGGGGGDGRFGGGGGGPPQQQQQQQAGPQFARPAVEGPPPEPPAPSGWPGVDGGPDFDDRLHADEDAFIQKFGAPKVGSLPPPQAVLFQHTPHTVARQLKRVW
jgi:hypothetical protein